MVSRFLLFCSGFLALVMLAAAPVVANESPATDCRRDLNFLPDFLLQNDAGARDRLRRIGRERLDGALEQALNRASEVQNDAACLDIINDYLSYWREGHLHVQAVSAEAGNLAEGSESDYDPVFRYLSADTVAIEIRSFHPEAGKRLQRELLRRREELESHRNWIIDVRDNHGGSDSAYQPLLPWLLSDDIVAVQLAHLATRANIESSQRACKLYAPEDAACEQFMQSIIERMKLASPGSFVSGSDSQIEYIRIPESPFKQPERVAVLIGEDCVSSCEQFLLTARQSFRVKLLGRSTKGNLDYSNLRPQVLPSSARQLLYATSRSYRLPEVPVDISGVLPDVYLPLTPAWSPEAELTRVQNWLEGGSLAPLSLQVPAGGGDADSGQESSESGSNGTTTEQ